VDAVDILITPTSPPAGSYRADRGQNGPMVVRPARRDEVPMITDDWLDLVFLQRLLDEDQHGQDSA
jgi:hypothetical protein